MVILTLLQIICFIGLMVICIRDFYQLKNCRWDLWVANLDIKRLREYNLHLIEKVKEKERRCVMLSLKCGERDNTIRQLHKHLGFRRATR